MLGKARMRLVSGIALFLAVVCVVAQSTFRGDMGNKGSVQSFSHIC
jgi:hypothetical protein